MNTKLLFSVCTMVCAIGVNSTCYSQPKINLVPFASGFTSPLDIANAGDDRLFIVQRAGLIRITDLSGNVFSSPFLNLTNKVHQGGNERGLLGLAFHPDYKNNGYFFVNYTRVTDGATVVSRFSVSGTNPDRADSLSEFILLTVPQPYSNHNGGNLLFGPDGYLYIAMGDGGSGGDPQNYSQNTNSFLGKMLRIDVDNGNPYSIPANNPFVGVPTVLDEIWALGLRNHWRNSFDRYTGDLWIADVGQSAWEEVNFQSASSSGGENYGWRCYEGSASHNLSGCGTISNYTFPVFEYAHSGSSCTGSITGGYVYRGALYNGMFGKYIVADYCKGNFYWVEKNGSNFTSGALGTFSPFQYSSFGEDRYGELYVTLLGNGGVRKVTDTSDCKPVAKIIEGNPVVVNAGDTAILHAFYHPTLNYQWERNGAAMSGETSHILKTTLGGKYTVEVMNPSNSCINVSDTVEVMLVTGVDPFAGHDLPINVFPNPVCDVFVVENLSSQSESEIKLFSAVGGLVYHETGVTASKITVETKHLQSGVYLLTVKTATSFFMQKVVIQ